MICCRMTVKMETVTLTGEGRLNLICLNEINSKIYFLSRHFILGAVILDLDKYIFLSQMCFIWGTVLD